MCSLVSLYPSIGVPGAGEELEISIWVSKTGHVVNFIHVFQKSIVAVTGIYTSAIRDVCHCYQPDSEDKKETVHSKASWRSYFDMQT